MSLVNHAWMIFLKIILITTVTFATNETIQMVLHVSDYNNICSENQTIGRAVLDSINMSWPGLEATHDSYLAGDLGAACDHLASYYNISNASQWLRWIPPQGWNPNSTKKAGGQADDLLNDIYYLSGVKETAKIPRNSDGGIDWQYKGPKHDPEFMNCLNRHQSFTILMNAWHKTGNPIYSKRFDALVSDWVTHLPCRAGVSREGWNASGSYAKSCATGTMESPWRTLEAGIRSSGPWAPSFFGFQLAKEFSVSSRVLMLLGLSEHNAVLSGPGFKAHTPNWAMTQWTGLVTTCVAFPELKNSSVLLDLALVQLEDLLRKQVYPDGIETEQSYGYDMGTAHDFFSIIELLNRSDHKNLSSFFIDRVEEMYNYGILIGDQQGYHPRNGDTDLGKVPWSDTVKSYFTRDDWLYVHTGGKKGVRPSKGPSVMFPWGGQAVLKSDYSSNGSWCWIDVGPYGSSGHAHKNKLAIAIRAFGSMLLVDSGRFQYNGVGLSKTLHDQYSKTTHAHNTLTIDGKEQKASPALANSPIPNSTWSFKDDTDFVRNQMSLYDGLKGDATHTRAVLYKRAQYFVVVDRIETDRPRSVQATWHAHPNSTINLNKVGVAKICGVHPSSGQPTQAQIIVIPAQGADIWNTSTIIKGQKRENGKDWQGWYSNTYNGAWPAPTLVYDTRINKDLAVFGWLLLPEAVALTRYSDVSMKFVNVEKASVTVEIIIHGKKETYTLSMEGDASLAQ